ncbi:MAG: hypothetical protein U5N86_05710 [Planctomycetota bacterium]|nr:hypothetical protein [Planctomycetota bacterium]
MRGFFRHPRHLLSPQQEKARYETHNNDVNDPRYQAFVSPIVSAVLRDISPNSYGLDFGAGTGPVISELLSKEGFRIVQDDPFFHNRPALLEERYDYIVCWRSDRAFPLPRKRISTAQEPPEATGKAILHDLPVQSGN